MCVHASSDTHDRFVTQVSEIQASKSILWSDFNPSESIKMEESGFDPLTGDSEVQ